MWKRVIFHKKADKNKNEKKCGTVYFQHGFEKETFLLVMYKKMAVLVRFKVECEEGKVTSAVCKYCPKVEYNAFMCEGQTRNIKCFPLKSVDNFRNPVTLHPSTGTC